MSSPKGSKSDSAEISIENLDVWFLNNCIYMQAKQLYFMVKRKPFGGYHIAPDVHLAKIIGHGKATPSQMTKKIWQYIKKHKLARH